MDFLIPLLLVALVFSVYVSSVFILVISLTVLVVLVGCFVILAPERWIRKVFKYIL